MEPPSFSVLVNALKGGGFYIMSIKDIQEKLKSH